MTDVRGATDVLRVPPKPPKTRMRDGVPWYESTKSANIVKIDAVKSIKPRPWKREHYGVRRDIHEEMVSRCGGTRASRQALDLAIHLLRYEKEHRSQMDKAEKNKISHRYRALSKLKDYLVAHGAELPPVPPLSRRRMLRACQRSSRSGRRRHSRPRCRTAPAAEAQQDRPRQWRGRDRRGGVR